MGRPVLALLAFLVGGLGFVASAYSHALQPGYLALRAIDKNTYAVTWKMPAVRGRPMPIAARLPESCAPRTPGQPVWDGAAYVARWTATCPGGPVGGTIAVEGLAATQTDVLVRIQRLDGTEQTARLTPAAASFVIEEAPGMLDVAGTYLLLGTEHILLGIDHLLFVLALLILVSGWRRLVWTITAFTGAHSITLAAATLGFVRVAPGPVEAVIALSIVFVAMEIVHTRQGRPGLTERTAARLRLRRRPIADRPPGTRDPAGIALLQRRGRGGTALVRRSRSGGHCRVAAPRSALAPMGLAGSGLHDWIAGCLLDGRAGGQPSVGMKRPGRKGCWGGASKLPTKVQAEEDQIVFAVLTLEEGPVDLGTAVDRHVGRAVILVHRRGIEGDAGLQEPVVVGTVMNAPREMK
jgi:hypothetical protein